MSEPCNNPCQEIICAVPDDLAPYFMPSPFPQVPITPPTPPPFVLSIACTPTTPHLSWTQGVTPDTNKIWRNQNGAGYLLVDSIPGAALVWDDSIPVPSGEIWCYKVIPETGGTAGTASNEGCAGNYFVLLGGATVSYPTLMVEYGDIGPWDTTATSFDLPSLICVGETAFFDGLTLLATIDLSALVSVGVILRFDFSGMSIIICPVLQTVGDSLHFDSCPNLTSASFPALATVGSRFVCVSSPLLVSVDAPLLVTVSNNIEVGSCASLTTLIFASLASVGGLFDASLCPALTSLNLTSLASVSGNFTLSDAAVLPSLSCPALTTAGDFYCSGCTLLTSVNLPQIVFQNGQTVDFNGCALDVTSVDQILARAVASGVTTCTIDLSGGSNAGLLALSAQGQSDYAALVLAGNTVTVNP